MEIFMGLQTAPITFTNIPLFIAQFCLTVSQMWKAGL